MYKVSEKPLISKDEIENRLESLGSEINASGEYDIVLGVLTGAFIFVADIVRRQVGNPRVAVF